MGDAFFEAYDREQYAYGDVPSAPLAEYLRQVPTPGGRGLDLGAGAGRDTIEMAKAGYEVTAVDLSERGAQRILERAENAELIDRVRAEVADVREYNIQPEHFDLICATTVLDHIPAESATAVWKRMTTGLRAGGILYAEVHSTEDPGSDRGPGLESDAPVSETANAVVNYFAPNQLAQWALQPESALRILRYEERLEWDYTHGPEHLHGKQILLAVRSGTHPPWYGQPAAFPRRQ